MKRNLLKIATLLIGMTLGSCSDFFEVDTDNVLDHTKYISEESEMYAGYIGIMTKVQAIGDKAIYLTDTAGSYWNLPTMHRVICLVCIIMKLT